MGGNHHGSTWSHRVVAVLCGLLSLATCCRAEQPWPLWQRYRNHFIDGSGRVVDYAADGHTTSEGMSYAMFFALVANDRSTFDKLLHWTEDNLAGGDLTAQLPAWNWGRTGAGDWKTLDRNPASDADLWIAYDLLEAGRLWQDDHLTKTGRALLDQIVHSEVAHVPGLGTVLLPGPVGFHPQPQTYIVNPSYTPPQLLARFQQEQPSGPWGAILDTAPAILRGASPAGFGMDWVYAGKTIAAAPSPADLAAGHAAAVPVGSYDAIRVYLWLGAADKDTPSVAASLQAVNGMARYMASNAVPPSEVGSDGTVLNAGSPVGFAASLVPYLAAVGDRTGAKTQLNRLAANVDTPTGLYGHPVEYYNQNLVLFATGFTEGRFRFNRAGRLKVKWN